MWYLDEQAPVTAGSPLPEDAIEVAIRPLEHESIEEAIRKVVTYMTDDCMRLGIRHIRFVCRSCGHATKRIEAHHTGGPRYDASVFTKERLYAAFR